MTICPIFIPSIERPEICARTVHKFRSPGTPVYVVTQRMYEKDYAAALGNSAKLLTLPPAYTPGVALARDYIVQYAYENSFNAILQADDDVQLGFRDDRGYAHSLGSSESCYSALATSMCSAVMHKSFALCGVRRRQACHTAYGLELPIRAVAVDVRKVISSGIRYAFDSPFSICEDYWVALSLLRGNYAWKILTGFTQGDSGTNAHGGCSTFRTADLQTRCAKRLQSEFPEWVQTRAKCTEFGVCLNPRFNRKAIQMRLDEILNKNIYEK